MEQNGFTNGNGGVDVNQQVGVASTVHPVAKAPMHTGGKIAALVPQTFEEVWRVAGIIFKSGLAPRDINSQERVTIAVLHGMELGLPPMMAVQRIAIINGRPAVWGDAVPAIALGTGQLKEREEHFEGQWPNDDFTAVCRIARQIGGTVLKAEARFSIADAKQAGLWDEREKVQRKSRDGGGTYEVKNDSPWHRFPKRMLQMRARSAFRDLFADAMCGLYIAEELVERDSDAEMRDITPPSHQIISNPLGAEDEEVARQTPEDAADEFTGAANGSQPVAATAAPEPPKEQDKPKATRKAKAKTETKVSTGWVKDAWKDGKPDPAPEADEVFPQPYIAQSAQSYVDYALRWLAKATDQASVRKRFEDERGIRNNLREPLSDDQKAKITEAAKKVGTAQ